MSGRKVRTLTRVRRAFKSVEEAPKSEVVQCEEYVPIAALVRMAIRSRRRTSHRILTMPRRKMTGNRRAGTLVDSLVIDVEMVLY